MLNWQQTDELYAIATDTTKSAEQRKSDILYKWGEFVNTYEIETDYTLAYKNDQCTYTRPIDASKQSGVKIPLVGQNGYSLSPGE